MDSSAEPVGYPDSDHGCPGNPLQGSPARAEATDAVRSAGIRVLIYRRRWATRAAEVVIAEPFPHLRTEPKRGARSSHDVRLTGIIALVMLLLGSCGPGSARAQEMAPRAYWPAPVGTDVLVLGWQRTTGDVLLDPSLPIVGVDSDVDYALVAWQHFFDLFGRTASLQISQPFADSSTRGEVEGEFLQRDIRGAGDLSLRWAINLAGAAAMDATGMQALRAAPRPIVGASVTVQLPTGAYDDDRVINLGTNRWAIKPAVGVILPLRPTWLLEVEGGGWVFGDNDDFLGATRTQAPIAFAEMHLIKRLRPGFWTSLDVNYYSGGETRIVDGPEQNLQRNSRAGVTVVVPLSRQQAVRASVSRGVVTRSGGDFDTLSLTWLHAW